MSASNSRSSVFEYLDFTNYSPAGVQSSDSCRIFRSDLIMKRIICAFSLVSLVPVLLLRISKPVMAAQQATSEQRPSHPRRIRVSEGVSNRLLITKVNPSYPDQARKKHVQGAVVLRVLIGDTGTVTDLSAISGDALLVPSALDAVRQWLYKPYLLNGDAIEVETRVTINFALRD
jgi:TonB family protein